MRYWSASIRSQMQYRASFIMLSLGTLAVTAFEFIAVWALFDRFKTLQGWHFAEIALFYGVINTTFSIAEATARSFDTFGDLVKRGDFDVILLKPRNTAFQIAARELDIKRVGRFAQGLAILVVAARFLDVTWNPARIGLLIGTIGSGVCLFYGLLILQATLAFWTTESLEVLNTVTYGGCEVAQYPLPIYQKWFRRFFTFVVPLACVAYLPLVEVLSRTDPLGTPLIVRRLAPMVGVLFLALATRVWELGVRHYRSTGS